jgi:hypothetical protein
VIALTRTLRGDNRSIGLLELDGQMIFLEDKIAAISALNKKENVDDLR